MAGKAGRTQRDLREVGRSWAADTPVPWVPGEFAVGPRSTAGRRGAALGSRVIAVTGLVALVERAVGHVVKAIMHADDSDGTTSSRSPRSGTPARSGERGLSAYRRAIEEREDGERVFAVRWARERLTILDGNGEAIVALLGGDPGAPHQFIRVCEAMVEFGREEEVLRWARRGIAETDGWQVEQLYDLACGVHERRSAALEVLHPHREQHGRMASASRRRRGRRERLVRGRLTELREHHRRRPTLIAMLDKAGLD